MALGDIGKLVFSSGQMCLSPSTVLVGSSFPYGGTALGLIKNTVLQCVRKTLWIKEESFGPMPYDGIDLGAIWTLTGSFRTYDSDVVNTFFPGVVTGGSTGEKAILYPNLNSYRTGGLLSSVAVKVLLAPDDAETHHFIYGYNAVPLTDDDSRMPFQRGEEWVVPFKMVFLPNGSNLTLAYMLKEDLQNAWTAYGQ